MEREKMKLLNFIKIMNQYNNKAIQGCDNLETIYLAQPNKNVTAVYKEYKSWFESAFPIFEQYHGRKVIGLDLPDIWVRDFLPLQNIQTGKLFSPFYWPSYKPKTLAQVYETIRARVCEIFPEAEQMPHIRLDGGNLIVNKCGVGFSVFNPKMYRSEQKDEIANALKSALGLTKLNWLPALPKVYDPFGHADGFGNFVGDNTVITCISDSADKTETTIHNEVISVIESSGIKCLTIRTKEKIDFTGDNKMSAKGCYGNFLETSAAVFVPQYNIPDDNTAMDIINSCTNKPVVGINCEAISKHGGSLHCITKEMTIIRGNTQSH